MIKFYRQEKAMEVSIMAVNISNKKPLTVNKRSKACNATKSRQKTNLQKKKVNGQTVLITAREAKKIA
jgi:ribosomal protein L28